jgi:hypothetical protein
MREHQHTNFTDEIGQGREIGLQRGNEFEAWVRLRGSPQPGDMDTLPS